MTNQSAVYIGRAQKARQLSPWHRRRRREPTHSQRWTDRVQARPSWAHEREELRVGLEKGLRALDPGFQKLRDSDPRWIWTCSERERWKGAWSTLPVVRL